MESDTIKELISPFKERLNNSMIGSFVLSWSVVNWKFLYILVVSDESAVKRIDLANQHLDDCNWLIPFLLMLLYVFALPWIEWVVGSINIYAIKRNDANNLERNNSNKKLKNVYLQGDKSEILLRNEIKNLEEIEEKLKKSEDHKIQLQQDIHEFKLKFGEKQQEIDKLTLSNNQLNGHIDSLETRYPGLKNDMNTLNIGGKLPTIEKHAVNSLNKSIDFLSKNNRDEMLRNIMTGNLGTALAEHFKNLSENEKNSIYNSVLGSSLASYMRNKNLGEQ